MQKLNHVRNERKEAEERKSKTVDGPCAGTGGKAEGDAEAEAEAEADREELELKSVVEVDVEDSERESEVSSLVDGHSRAGSLASSVCADSWAGGDCDLPSESEAEADDNENDASRWRDASATCARDDGTLLKQRKFVRFSLSFLSFCVCAFFGCAMRL